MNFIQHSLANPIAAKSQQNELADGTRFALLDTGVLRVSPAKSDGGSRIVISCGIHGNETAPIEIVEQLLEEIISGDLVVKEQLLFILGNPSATNAQTRFVEENLNRLFSGKHLESESLESARAAQLESHVQAFYEQDAEPSQQRLHYDLHTSIRGSQFNKFCVYPFLHKRQWSVSQLAFLESCGIEAVLLSNQAANTFSHYTSHTFGAHAFTLELGKARRFGENNLSDFEDAAAGLRRVIGGQEQFNSKLKSMKIFRVVEEVIKRSERFKLHFADDAKNFTEFKKGALLASDQDYEYRTKQDGERFVFPIINVPVGQRAMLVVAPTEL